MIEDDDVWRVLGVESKEAGYKVPGTSRPLPDSLPRTFCLHVPYGG